MLIFAALSAGSLGQNVRARPIQIQCRERSASGSNTPIACSLTDQWYYLMALMGISAYEAHISTGWQSVVKASLFTIAMPGIFRALTMAKVRLQL